MWLWQSAQEVPSNGATVQTLQKDESFLETLFVKGSPSVARSSRLRSGNRETPTKKKAKMTRCLFTQLSQAVFQKTSNFMKLLWLKILKFASNWIVVQKLMLFHWRITTISGEDHRWQRRTLCWFPSLSTDWNLVEKWFWAPSTKIMSNTSSSFL